MSTNSELLKIWNFSGHQPPKVQLILVEGELLPVISDSEGFVKYMSLNGQVYLALKDSCEVKKKVYLLRGLSSPVNTLEGRDMFVLNKLLSYLAGRDPSQ